MRHMLLAASIVLAGLTVLTASAQLSFDSEVARPIQRQAATGDDAPAVQTIRATRAESALSIDGLHDDVAWRSAQPITRFTQRDPDEGAEPTQRTEVRVVYDDDALFVSARMFDSAPDSIVARLGRRDATSIESDNFVMFIDPYNDDRSGYYFGINAAGTLYDGVLMNDDWDDETWDGVWEANARIDDQGWTAEFRIPYSQLRFYAADEHVWGINFRREIVRKNELDYVVYTPRNESGFVSRFPDLVGMRGIAPKRQIEVVPYLTARAEFLEHDEGDPFNDGSRYVPSVGADLKMGIASNLTLNATINPDFGQVEVDPAVVNLSDVETFFPEKRPFFIEGNTVFRQFGRGGSNNNWGFNWGNPNFFYSRRVGRPPQGSLPDHDFAESREGTRILGAAKVTGRIGNGWNVGTVQALTERAISDYQLGGERLTAEAEPLAYYGVLRGQKELNDGRQAVGFMSTVAARDFRDDRLLDEINKSAFTFAADGWTFLDKDKTWVLTGWAGLSRVSGTTQRITDLQRSSLHYFQRPDAQYVSVDSSATSLTGTAGRLVLNKQRGRFTTNVAVGYISPSFDVNDLGFMWQTGMINSHAVLAYQWTDPGTWYRKIFAHASAFNTTDFDGNTIWRGLWTGNFIELLNYHEIFFNVAYNPETISNRLTRGGPLTLNQPGWQFGLEYETDGRKRWAFEFGLDTYRQKDSRNFSVSTEAVWQPASNISVAVQPEIEWNNEFAQWVGDYEDPLATRTFGTRYVFAELDQVEVSSRVRLNWTFSPVLSLQLFAQPLISSGDFSNYKELRAPKTFDFINYGSEGSTFDSETLIADPDGPGPAAPLNLEDSDFNFRSLRGTAVVRWEYSPGSTIFFVWTQTRSASEEYGDLRLGSSLGGIFDARPDNIFMVKLTYWLSR
ncbi:MAG: carbohydrate binding family 9 domain-containing protein [Rhodothermales bacterium]|nr:carbohydrate binding family 9 domain-containing protein [Rhodothermales bacterium]